MLNNIRGEKMDKTKKVIILSHCILNEHSKVKSWDTEEKVTELNQNVRENKHTEQTKNSIGYYNVNAIIKLNYGEAYGLQAYAREGEGTTVVVLVPKKYV